MRSTFKPGQVLYTRPEGHGIRPGDVVVYQKGMEYIVHRVTSIQEDGIHTRGDDNFQEDQEPISADQILGVVEKADEWGKQHKVPGGRKAYLSATLRWKLLKLFRDSLPWLGFPYRWLKTRHWVARFWHPLVTQVQLVSPGRRFVKYLVRGKTVATWEPDTGHFTFRKPYDLVIFPPTKE